MTEKKHIDVDLNFLDKGQEAAPAKSRQARTSGVSRPSQGSPPSSQGLRIPRSVIVVGGIFALIWVIGAFEDTSPTTSPPSTSPSSVVSGNRIGVGDYYCSQYHSDQAERIEPSTTESALEREQRNLQYEADDLESLVWDVENGYYDVDSYNSRIDDYNYEWNRLDRRIDAYNADIGEYNAYLEKNCDPR